MGYTKRTGGVKEFHYTKDDLERIESQDTESTREFKEALRKWRSVKGWWNKRKALEKIKEFEKVDEPFDYKKYTVRHLLPQAKEKRKEGLPEKKRKEISKVKKTKRNISKKFKIIILILFIIISFILLFNKYIQKPDILLQEKNVTENKTVTITESVPETISIEQYIANKTLLDKKYVSIKGYLHYKFIGQADAGYFSKRLIDDFGNEIELVTVGTEYKDMFKKNQISSELYKVSGRFDRGYYINKLRVREIEKTAKPMKRVTRIVTPPTQEEIIDIKKESKIEIIFAKTTEIFEDIKSKIRDFTLETKKFSKEKVEDLKDLTKECPLGYTNYWGECVQTCTDKTIFGKCSNKKPYYCDNGELVERASLCGCPSEFYPEKDTCVSILRGIEKEILEYTNEQRKANGISTLIWSDKISSIARAHSEDMVSRDYFSHININGEDPSARARRMRFSKRKELSGGWYTEGLAENIGKMPTGNVEGIGYVSNIPKDIAHAQVNSWMSSHGHRENILNPQYSHLGVGVAYDGVYYISTQNFW